MTEFVLKLDNRPGALARLTELLAGGGVNIEALAAWGMDDEGIVRLITDDTEATRRLLSDAGLAVTEHQVLATFLPHQPGELARVARSLADAGVNIDALYVLRAMGNGIELAFAVDQPESAAPHLPVRGGAGH